MLLFKSFKGESALVLLEPHMSSVYRAPQPWLTGLTFTEGDGGRGAL